LAVHLSVVMPVYNERHLVAESIARVLAVETPLISRLDLIVVDDGSTDGTRAILRALADKHRDRITYLEHESNRGKGAAVRTGIARARGSVTVIQDADLEYHPNEFERLMLPFVREDADAVYGSRFLTREYRRVLYYRHALGNQLITTLCNLLSDLNLTDMETCYKAVRTRLLVSIPLRSDDFRIEPELTLKLARRGARIFEVPINYAGRTYEEGKKIGLRDAFLAVVAMLRFSFSSDVYASDREGATALVALSSVSRFNRWMADAIRPWLGDRVLEIGAGIGSLTRSLLPRDRYTVSEVNPDYLEYLRGFARGKPYMEVAHVDLADSDDFYDHLGAYDTVLCLNVLEHVADEDAALRNVHSALAPGGRAIVLVPQGPRLYGALDEAVGHYRRYTRATLRGALERAGFAVEEICDFNRASAPAWWINGVLLRRRRFSRVQLALVDRGTWLLRRLDRVLPWAGVSLIAVARPLRPMAGDE
jgi:2-polyprenyl-3-methyl-5-hydroxy-6-metoxy-1,4-benzoquinol methylase